MASSSITLQTLHLRSNFPGKTTPSIKPSYSSLVPRDSRLKHIKTYAKFNLSELLGGRGLCNGEEGLEKLLKEPPSPAAPAAEGGEEEASSGSQLPAAATEAVPEDAFDKELMGLTGGFPGGEKGLQKFIEENPPPSKTDSEEALSITAKKKPKAPQLPLLMPGMIAVVKDPNNPYYMYCGIIQRITDGKAGLLLEGGVWDRLITFRLEELERREKGPPGKNPRSVILEKKLEKKDSQSG